MRVMVVAVILFVLSVVNEAVCAPTVYFKDGSHEVGSSIWMENGKIYLNKANEIFEYGADEVLMDETQKNNRIGTYAPVAPPVGEIPAASATSWLLGTWELVYDPDGDDKDYLDFFADGKADSRGGNGAHRYCTYEVKSSEVLLQLAAKGAKRNLSLQIMDNGKKLKNSSGAIYAKTAIEGIDYSKSGWNRFTSRDGKFSVLMYGVPKLETQKYENAVATAEAKMFLSVLDHGLVLVYYVALPAAADPGRLNDMYSSIDKIAASNMEANGMNIVESKGRDITFKGVKAREIVGTAKTGFGTFAFRHVITVHNKKIYQFMTYTEPGSDSFSRKFFDSVRFMN